MHSIITKQLYISRNNRKCGSGKSVNNDQKFAKKKVLKTLRK